ncbi:nuclear transport factor 2 family protein [Chryseolinea sp. T2]|uniref:nuclear transport factor 2 family protein n=1 Tax=Chryseolinea sp. T2 TaxID=3129255 RepID=UPI00307694F9
MDTTQIANKLVDYCKRADWEGAHSELYSSEAISIEPFDTPEYGKETKGLAGIRKKGEKFDSTVEKYHHIDVSSPLIAGNTIAFTLTMDMEIKGKGRMKSPELCVYEVKDGKIASERFFV